MLSQLPFWKDFDINCFSFFPRSIIHGNLSTHNLFPQRHTRQPMADFNIEEGRAYITLLETKSSPPSNASPLTPPSVIICYAEFCKAIKINSQWSFHPKPPASNNGLSQQVFIVVVWLPIARLKVLFFGHFFFFFFYSPTCNLLICSSCQEGSSCLPRGDMYFEETRAELYLRTTGRKTLKFTAWVGGRAQPDGPGPWGRLKNTSLWGWPKMGATGVVITDLLWGAFRKFLGFAWVAEKRCQYQQRACPEKYQAEGKDLKKKKQQKKKLACFHCSQFN